MFEYPEHSDRVEWSFSGGATWVATQSSVFLGMVELHAGRFVANDTVHGTYQTFGTFAEACRALDPPAGDYPLLGSTLA